MTTTTSETITKYAPYIESAHKTLLNRVSADTTGAKNDNPYTHIINNREISPHTFFSTNSLRNSYKELPSLFHSWDNHIKDFNITTLWATLFDDTTDNVATRQMVAAERAMLEDAIDQDAMPRIQVGMRDINAVNSSAFVIARGNLEDSKEKELAKFSAELQYRLLNIVIDRYKTHLSWQSGIVGSQMDAIKMFFSTEYAFQSQFNDMKAKQRSWRSDMNEYYRVAVAAMQGATRVSSTGTGSGGGGGGGGGYSAPTATQGYNTGPVTQSSSGGGALAGAATGAMMGSMVGGAPGALIGGAIGGIGGLFGLW